MTKNLKNRLLILLTTLLVGTLAIFGVSLATPLQSAKADTFSCDHKENLVAIAPVENIQGKTLRLSPPVSDSPTTLCIYTVYPEALTIDIFNSASDGQGITMGCATGQLNTEDYFTWTYCAEGNHFDLKFLQTATYLKENSDENIFVNAETECSVPVYVVGEETEEPGTDTEQPEQKPIDTTNWFKHEYTSETSVQGQYVRFERTAGHENYFVIVFDSLSAATFMYDSGAFRTSTGNTMTGEAVVLRSTDTVVDAFFSADFAVEKISVIDVDSTLETNGISVYLLSQDGNLENNPSAPVVPDDPNTDKPDDGDGSVDQQPSGSKNEDLKDTNANLDFIKISDAGVSMSVLGFVVYYIIRRIRR